MVKVYLSTEPRHWLAGEVLRYSLLKRTSAKVEIVELNQIPQPASMRVGLSFSRFYLPFFENYQGKVLFLKSDMIVLDDIQKLFDCPMQSPALARSLSLNPAIGFKQGFNTDVLLLDCSQLKDWKPEIWISELRKTPPLMKETLLGLPGSLAFKDFSPLDPLWNEIDQVSIDTKILHFYNYSTLPWLSTENPGYSLFMSELKDAMADQEISRRHLQAEVTLGHIHPSFLSI